jgi:hypothetical protein
MSVISKRATFAILRGYLNYTRIGGIIHAVQHEQTGLLVDKRAPGRSPMPSSCSPRNPN